MITVTDDGIVLAHVTAVEDVEKCNALGDGYEWGFAVRLCGSDRFIIASKTEDEAKAERNEMIRLLRDFWKAQEDE